MCQTKLMRAQANHLMKTRYIILRLFPYIPDLCFFRCHKDLLVSLEPPTPTLSLFSLGKHAASLRSVTSKFGFARQAAQWGEGTMGSTFMKAIYREYTDDTFTKRKPQMQASDGMAGPTIIAEVGDLITVVFRVRFLSLLCIVGDRT